MNFAFDSDLRRSLGYRLIDRIDAYFSSLPDRPVQLPSDQRTFSALTDVMPELAEDAIAVLDDVCREMIDKGFHVPAANYFGLMNPTPAYMAVLAEALVAALNPQLATLARSQLASKIENETVRWIGERVGWPRDFGGTFTSGGNEANFTALALALAHAFPEYVSEGVLAIGAQPVFYCSSEAHHSLDKSAGLLGIGRRAVRRMRVNSRIQLDPVRLREQIEEDIEDGLKPFCVVATAGTTNSGAIDDLEAVAEVAREFQLWLHVDGAYGAAAIFSDSHRDLVRGIELADSITIDPHKWLAMPFAAGVVLTSHPEMLEQTFAITTPYMPKVSGATQIDNFKLSTQWSRRMNSLKVYLTLRVHGRQAYEQLIDEQMKLKDAVSVRLKNSKYFELANDPALPIFNLRIKTTDHIGESDYERLHNDIVHDVTRDGQRWISLTKVDGRSVIRFMIISYLTTAEHLNALVDAIEKAALHALPQATSARV
ncbi:MAG TPA: pyridoxal-dependent decarboxylase [Terriglobales bacterium]